MSFSFYPSEGKGQQFESARERHYFNVRNYLFQLESFELVMELARLEPYIPNKKASTIINVFSLSLDASPDIFVAISDNQCIGTLVLISWLPFQIFNV